MIDEIGKLGFEYTGVRKCPAIGEFYVDKNNERVCYVYDENSIPCSCEKCGNGIRAIVEPIGYIKRN